MSQDLRMPEPWPKKNIPKLTAINEGDETSLFCGGPFYRAQVRARLAAAGRWNCPACVTCALLICWVPLVVITSLLYREHMAALARDYSVYSRIVVAIPALLIGQLLMESGFRATVVHVREADLLDADDSRQLAGLLGTLKRLRDSAIPELIILVLVYAELVSIWQVKLQTAPAWAAYSSGGATHATLAGWYYGLVSVPIYQFLIGLNLWKWGLWSFFLFRLSRMDLKLVATHPDGHGSLGFLGLSPISFCPIAIALSAAIGGTWRGEILNNRATLSNFWLPAAILLGLMFVAALAPLAFFVRRLASLRRKAILDYGVLAQRHAMAFQKKWILGRDEGEREYFTGTEVSALADLTVAYGQIKRLGPFPADRGTLVSLALSVLVPLFPVVLAEIPLSVILRGLMQAVKAVPL